MDSAVDRAVEFQAPKGASLSRVQRMGGAA
jgi:hypothetical protein